MSIKGSIWAWLKRIGWTLLVGGFVVLVSASTRYQYGQSLTPEPRINIDYTDGLYFVSENDVKEAIGTWLPGQLSGYSIGQLDLRALEIHIKLNPYVRTVDAFVDHNGKLTVDVAQRAPIVRVINRRGVSYYLDGWGEKIPVTDNFTSRVPVLSGHFSDNGLTTGTVETEEMQRLFKLASHLRSEKFYQALIDQIHVERDKNIVLIPKIDRHKVIIGDTENLKDKLNRLKLFYEQGLKDVGWKEYSTVDVRFKNQVVCKK